MERITAEGILDEDTPENILTYGSNRKEARDVIKDKELRQENVKEIDHLDYLG
jgi:hypothetical protein